jgi:hypothetical protein
VASLLFYLSPTLSLHVDQVSDPFVFDRKTQGVTQDLISLKYIICAYSLSSGLTNCPERVDLYLDTVFKGFVPKLNSEIS